MKILALVFLVGYASAFPTFSDILDDAAEEIYHDFLVGMEDAPSLKRALGLQDDFYFADDVENDIKTELGKKLRDHLNEILEKIKDSVEKGKIVREDLQKKLQEIKEKMKELKVELGGKAKELLDKIREQSKDFLKKLLDNLGFKNDKRSVDEDFDIQMIDFNLKDMFNKLKKAILDKLDKEKLKEAVENIFGKGNDMADSLLEIINEKGDKYKQKILDLIDRYLQKKERRSLKEYWDKVKDYFKDLHIDLKEKYFKFGEWVKNVIDKGINKSKDKLENIKSIAREFKDHVKDLSKDVAAEGLEFLRPYKEDLGTLWDQVKDSVKEVMNRRD